MGRHKTNIVLFKPFETRNPTGKDKAYLRLTRGVFYSDAFRDLTGAERTMFIDMRMCARGESTVTYSQEMAKKRFGISSSTYAAGIVKIIKVGFIKRLPRSKYDPNRFEFVCEWKKYVSPNRNLFTDEYEPKKRK